MQEPTPDSNNIYLMLGEMRGMLSTIMAQLDTAHQKHTALSTRLDIRLEKHDQRINRLEASNWKVMGIVSLVPIALTLAGLIFAYIKL